MAKAENKTKATGASVAKFLGALDEERQRDCRALVKMMTRVAKAKPKMWGPTIVGFGDYHYEYESGREGDICLVGFSPRKELVLYMMGCGPREEALMGKLGKYKRSKGCLYIKRLSDVDVAVLEKIVAGAAKNLKSREAK